MRRPQVRTCLHVNRKSFRTGEPENSGFSKIQLITKYEVSDLRSWSWENSAEIRPESKEKKRNGKAYFRKYCSPALLFSRNRGRNREMTLFGGRTGTAASKAGNVSISARRKSSNSE